MRGEGAAPEVLQGETAPRLGWRSPVYGQRSPCTVIRRTVRVKMPATPVTMETIITLSGQGPDNIVMGETVMRWQKWAQDAAAH
jgi:hypothetical protein